MCLLSIVSACVIVANKWDAVEKDEKTFNEAIRYVREELFAVNWAEVSGYEWDMDV